jgi:predicted O-methyltransferase YrrM
VAGRVELRLGDAQESLARLAAEGAGPFDLIFIDADKPATAEYFAWAMKLIRSGGMILTDNVVRNGALADENSADANVRGVRRFAAAAAAEPRATTTVVQTVGSKGYDGFAVSVIA